MTLQNDLRRLYEEFKSRVDVPRSLAKRLSAPLLMYPTKRWLEAEKKVLVVGQETYGWGVQAGSVGNRSHGPIDTLREFMDEPHSVTALMSKYSKFACGDEYRYSGSPFWCAFKELGGGTDSTDQHQSTDTLWMNLMRMDLQGDENVRSTSVYKNTKTWKEFFEIQDIGRNLLTNEIQIIKPKMIVFFTGPNYDRALDHEFEGIERQQIKDYPIRQFAALNHDCFGDALAYRTYHPRYLRTSHQWFYLKEMGRTIV